jgi:hypothetical protein
LNDSEKVISEIPASETDSILPAELLRMRSAWFSEKIAKGPQSVLFTMANNPILECVLEFMCTGVVRTSLDLRKELQAALDLAIVARKLKTEDLEWCALGRLEGHLEGNQSTYLSQSPVKHVFHETEDKSHLRDWLADHVTGSLCTGLICAGDLNGLIATSPDFAIKITISIPQTAVEVTNTLLNVKLSEIERARGEVMY